MEKVHINSRDLAEYLYHNLLFNGYDPDYEECLLIADMLIDFLSLTTKAEYITH